MSKILVVDDDNELRLALVDSLESLGHTIDESKTGDDALQLLENFHYDLIVLDWSLPGMNGDEICARYRRKGGQSPIIFLTGKADVRSKETGLDLGADDYVVKPFEVRELLARVRALLRRRSGTILGELQVHGLCLDVDARTVTFGEKVVELRAKEVSLLEFLMRNTDRVYSAEQLINAVWSSQAEVTTGSVRSWMNLLRQKLAEVGKPDLIQTVSRSGYVIRT